MTTAQRSGSSGRRYHYYVDHNLRADQSGAVNVCDHACDCDPVYREATEKELGAHIGTEVLRVAQVECAWNGLGSTCLMVYPVLDRETGDESRVITRGKRRWVLRGWAGVACESAVDAQD